MQPPVPVELGVIVFLLFWAIVIALSIAALLYLRGRSMNDIAQAIWAIFIVAVPIAGPIACFIVGPGERRQRAG